jgi:tRNA(fMet)-specific endonuclease VapC
MKPIFMLDTNAVSALIRGKSSKIDKAVAIAGSDTLCISVITEAEIRFGLARKPEAIKIAISANALLAELPILDWCSPEAAKYASMRAKMEASGATLSHFDALIAAHALAADCTLITADKAFSMVPNLKIENWEV